MVLFYSDVNSFSDNQDSNTTENSSFLPSSNIYERVRSEIPSNPSYNYTKITNRLDKLEKLMNKIYTSNIENKELRRYSPGIISEFNLEDDVNNLDTTTDKLLFQIKTYLLYILIALSFIIIKLYKINLTV